MEHFGYQGSKIWTGTQPRSLWVGLALLLCLPCWAQQPGPPRSLVVYRSLQPLTIDGRGDEESWEKAPWSEPFIDIEGEAEPPYRTRMKMLWDDTYLYFHAQSEEPHLWGNL